MANEPIRQHLVPRMYLRAFCASPGEREQIYAFDLAQGRAFKTSIANVAVMRHFYTLGLGQEQPSYAVEDALARLESDVKPILDQIIDTEDIALGTEQRWVFANFLSTLFMRTRQGLQMIHGHREEIRTTGGQPGFRLSPSYKEGLLGLDGDGMRELFAKTVIAVGGRLSTLFDSMHWCLFRVADGHLITSENPLVVYHDTEMRWGIGTPGTHIHLPLSPKLVLHISKEPLMPSQGTYDLPAAGAQGLNGLTVLSAEQYLFSHTDFDAMSDLLADRSPGGRRAFGPHCPEVGSD